MKISIFSAAVLSALISFQAWADVPQQINYQGFLTDSAGDPVYGTVNFSFSIYEDETGGTSLWSEVHPDVELHGGLFNVVLGIFTPINIDFEGDYWLEIEVDGEVQTPRLPLTSVGQAFHALNAEDVFDQDINPRSVSITGYGVVIDETGQWVGDPTGLQGPTGPQGDTGPMGPQGHTGPVGPQGDTGPAGPQGDTGLMGPQGHTGPIGPQGDTGPVGPQGDTGLMGPQGHTGPIGPQGDTGPAGPQGDTGLMGPQGDTGMIGPQGHTGPAGPQGDTGFMGPQGHTGPIGPQGDTGPIGPQGDTGPTGPVAGSDKQVVYNDAGSAGGSNIHYDKATDKVGIGVSNPSEKLTVDGTIESLSGGVKFPDGTLQTTAASGSGAALQLIYRDSSGASTGTTGWTLLHSHTIPAGTLQEEMLIIVRGRTNGAGGGANQSWGNLQLKVNSTTVENTSGGFACCPDYFGFYNTVTFVEALTSADVDFSSDILLEVYGANSVRSGNPISDAYYESMIVYGK